jgi:hypothetical protein
MSNSEGTPVFDTDTYEDIEKGFEIIMVVV